MLLWVYLTVLICGSIFPLVIVLIYLWLRWSPSTILYRTVSA